jgi:hypothetical protein
MDYADPFPTVLGDEQTPSPVNGKQLLCARILLGVTMQQVAERLEISRASVRRAEQDNPCSRRTTRQLTGMYRRNGIVFAYGGVHLKKLSEAGRPDR